MFYKLTIALISLILLTGCGDTTEEDIVISESTIIQEAETLRSDISEVIYDNKVQELLYMSKEGTVGDVTYICIGNSIRAVAEETPSYLLFP